jgi:hypothetical protein
MDQNEALALALEAQLIIRGLTGLVTIDADK